ncbi:MAG: hypothetical protein WCU88_13120 [Elusimicrobiota bacterium]|jgi:hypothetical protein
MTRAWPTALLVFAVHAWALGAWGAAPDCYPVDGLAFTHKPGRRETDAVILLKPPIFGVVYDPGALRWLSRVDEQAVFGYDFLRFYGSPSVAHLERMASLLGPIDILGWCPGKTNLSSEEFSRGIGKLKELFPGKKLLVGPCVGLFERVSGSTQAPEFLGFELRPSDMDGYLAGKYDAGIGKTLGRGTDAFAFVTISNGLVNLRKLEKVLRKSVQDGRKIGYTLDGNKRVLDFVLSHHCGENIVE